MTNEEKAREISDNILGSLEYQCGAEEGALKMAQWKDKQLKEVCKKCEQHIIDSGKRGCAFRSLSNEYCWED